MYEQSEWRGGGRQRIIWKLVVRPWLEHASESVVDRREEACNDLEKIQENWQKTGGWE